MARKISSKTVLAMCTGELERSDFFSNWNSKSACFTRIAFTELGSLNRGTKPTTLTLIFEEDTFPLIT